jgi:type 1 fimbriae regulatory protein FimB
MLRHSCGYDMVNRGVEIRVMQQWLGHKDIHMTVKYTELAVGALRGAMPD